METSLQRRHIIGWSYGGLGTAVYLGITMNYFLYFLTEGAAITPGMASWVLLAPRLWDVVTDPIMGAISDRTPGRMGRRRPWILFGGLLFALSFYLMFAIPDYDSEQARALWVVGFYLLVGTGYTMYEVPLNAMLPELSQNYRQRSQLAGYMMLSIRVGLIGTMLIGPIIFAATDDLAAGFRWVGAFAAIVIASCAIIVFVSTSDAPRIDSPPASLNVVSELKALWLNRPFRVLALVHLLKMTGIGAAATSVIYYLVFVLQAPEQAAGVILSVTATTATLVIPLWMWAMSKFGKKTTYSLGLGVLTLTMLPMLVIEPTSLAGSYNLPYFNEVISGGIVAVTLAMIVMSFGDSGAILVPNGMIPDTVEADELQTGVRREGTILGAWAFTRKLGMALGAWAITLFLAQSGFVPNQPEQTEAAITGIRYAYVLFPCACYLLSLIVLQRYDLTEERFAEITATLKSRNAREASQGV